MKIYIASTCYLKDIKNQDSWEDRVIGYFSSLEKADKKVLEVKAATDPRTKPAFWVDVKNVDE